MQHFARRFPCPASQPRWRVAHPGLAALPIAGHAGDAASMRSSQAASDGAFGMVPKPVVPDDQAGRADATRPAAWRRRSAPCLPSSAPISPSASGPWRRHAASHCRGRCPAGGAGRAGEPARAGSPTRRMTERSVGPAAARGTQPPAARWQGRSLRRVQLADTVRGQRWPWRPAPTGSAASCRPAVQQPGAEAALERGERRRPRVDRVTRRSRTTAERLPCGRRPGQKRIASQSSNGPSPPP